MDYSGHNSTFHDNLIVIRAASLNTVQRRSTAFHVHNVITCFHFSCLPRALIERSPSRRGRRELSQRLGNPCRRTPSEPVTTTTYAGQSCTTICNAFEPLLDRSAALRASITGVCSSGWRQRLYSVQRNNCRSPTSSAVSSRCSCRNHGSSA
jgi:hypothetical protein